MSNSKGMRWVLVVLVLLLAGGCVALYWKWLGGKYVQPIPEMSTASPDLEVDVYLDHSGSMAPFLNPGTANNPLYYLLDHTGKALMNGSWEGKLHAVRFWTFGGKKNDPPEKSIKRVANEYDFADLGDQPGGFREADTKIEQVAAYDAQASVHPGEHYPEVQVIITDLRQSDGHIGEVGGNLASRFLNPAKGSPSAIGAVAVLGIRNPFAGPVEDVPGIPGGLPPKAADTMPFYVLIAGDNSANVRRVEQLLLNAAIQPSRLGFSAYFSKYPGLPSDSKPDFDPRIDKLGSPLNGQTHGSFRGKYPASSEDKFSPLEIRKGVIRVGWADPLTSDAGRVLLLGSNPKVQIKAWNAKAERSGPLKNLLDERATRKANQALLSCRNWHPVCTVIDDSWLHDGRDYLFEFDVIAPELRRVLNEDPVEDSKGDSIDIHQWSISTDEIHSRVEKDEGVFETVNGKKQGKTPNLADFLDQLQGHMFQNTERDPVRVTTHFLYVKSK